MERNNNRFASKHLMCKKMREALSTFPAFGAISRRFSLQKHSHNPKTVTHDSNNYPPPSSPPVIRTVHIQAKPQDSSSSSSTETVPINIDYTIPAPIISTAEKKDMNSLFDDYIKNTRFKITSVPNVAGKGQGDTLVDDKDVSYYKDHHGGTKKDNNQSESFSNFIHRSRRKIRTTSVIRRE